MADHAFVYAKESSYRDNHGDLTLRRMVNDVKKHAQRVLCHQSTRRCPDCLAMYVFYAINNSQ